jgi:hypothetical protein
MRPAPDFGEGSTGKRAMPEKDLTAYGRDPPGTTAVSDPEGPAGAHLPESIGTKHLKNQAAAFASAGRLWLERTAPERLNADPQAC